MINKRLILLALLFLPCGAAANHLEVSRLASLLEHASGNLAFGVSNLQGYQSVELHARRLSETAERLLDSVNSGRTSTYVRIRFTDVTRYYQRLEAAYQRTGSRRSTRQVQEQFGHVAGIYDSLRLAFYGDAYTQGYLASPQIYLYVPDSRVNRYYPRYEPPRHRGDDHSGYGNDRQDYRSPAEDRQRRQDRNDRSVAQDRAPRQDYDHRSTVEDRQRRQDNNDRRVAQDRPPRQDYDHRSAVEDRARRQLGSGGGGPSYPGRETGRGVESRGSDRSVANQGYTRLGDSRGGD